MALAGCGQIKSNVAETAESTRTSVEQLSRRMSAKADEKELAIQEEADPMSRSGALALGQRYYSEAGPTGWVVRNLETGEVMASEKGPMEGLTQAEAEEFVNALRDADSQ